MKELLGRMSVKADAAGRMPILNPYTRLPLVNAETGESAWVDVLSDTSKEGAKWLRENIDKTLARRGRNQKADDLESDIAAKAARLTVGWNLISFDGEPIAVPFSGANAREMYAWSEMLWLREQVLEFAADLGNYRERPSMASPITPSTSSASTAA